MNDTGSGDPRAALGVAQAELLACTQQIADFENRLASTERADVAQSLASQLNDLKATRSWHEARIERRLKPLARAAERADLVRLRDETHTEAERRLREDVAAAKKRAEDMEKQTGDAWLDYARENNLQRQAQVRYGELLSRIRSFDATHESELKAAAAILAEDTAETEVA